MSELLTRPIDRHDLETEDRVRRLLCDLEGRAPAAASHNLLRLTIQGQRGALSMAYHATGPGERYRQTAYQNGDQPTGPTERSNVGIGGYELTVNKTGTPELRVIPDNKNAQPWTVHPDLALLYEILLPAWEAGYGGTLTADMNPGTLTIVHRIDRPCSLLRIVHSHVGQVTPPLRRIEGLGFVFGRHDRSKFLYQLHQVNRAYLQTLAERR